MSVIVARSPNKLMEVCAAYSLLFPIWRPEHDLVVTILDRQPQEPGSIGSGWVPGRMPDLEMTSVDESTTPSHGG